MESQILLKDDSKYTGKYVALDNLTNKNVVSSGIRLSTAMRNAKEKGVRNPIIIYVPEKNMTHIY